MADNTVNLQIVSVYDPAGGAAAEGGLGRVITLGQSIGPATAAGAQQAEGALRGESAAAGQAGKTLGDAGNAGKKAGADTAAGAREGEGALHRAAAAAADFVAALKTGVSIDLGHRLVEGLLEVPALLREGITAGVEFDRQMESLGIGLASSLRQSLPEDFGNFNAGLRGAGDLLDFVRQKALDLNLSTIDLGHNLQINMLALAEGGIKDLNAQVETTGLLMQAAASKGVTGFQAVRDIVDILQGRAERVILSKELGITNEDIKQAREAGQLAEYLAGKLGAYREAATAAGQSFDGLKQRLDNLLQSVEGQVAAPVFDALKEGLRELDALLERPEVVDGLRSIGFEVSHLVGLGSGLLNFCVSNAGALTLLAEGTAAWGAAVAAVKIKDLVVGLGAKVLGLEASTVATARETAVVAEASAATAADTRAKQANAAASREQAGAAAGQRAGQTPSAAAGAAAGLATTLNVGLAAGVALAAVIEVLTAKIEAATAKSAAVGKAFDDGRQSLLAQIRAADTAQKQAEARLNTERQIVTLAERLATLRPGEERDRTGQQLALAQAELASFDRLAGSAAKVTEQERQAAEADALRDKLQGSIAAKQREIAATEEQLGVLRGINAPATQLKVRQDQLALQQQDLSALRSAVPAQEAIAKSAHDLADARRNDLGALKEAGALLDQNNADNQTAAAQARLYADALDEVVRKIQEATGLDAETIRNLRSGNDLRAAAVGLTEKQRDALKGYVANLVEARNAADKADETAEKAAKKEGDAYDKNLGIIAATNAKLADQKVRLDDLKAGDRPNKSQEILDLERQITAELAKQTEAQAALKKIESDRARAKEQAHPTATTNRDTAQRALDADPLDPSRDYSDAELQARADRRAADRAERDRQQRIIDGQLGPDELDTSGDTGPLSDANYEETARSRVPAAAALAKATDGVASAINDTLAPANAQLTAAAAALPGQLQPITAGLGTLFSTQGEHFDALVGLLDTQAAVSESQAGMLGNLLRRFSALETRVANIADDYS